MTKIKINDLCFSYGDRLVLDHISLCIESETIDVLLGLNGSGKTTLIKSIVGILSVQPNSIFLNDTDVAKLHPHEISKLISYVPQTISDDNDFPVMEYLTFGRMNSIKFYASPKKADYDRAKEIASELDIEALLDKKMNELSGGQRQLVVIARAVVQDSETIVMDEPTSSIDLKYLDKIIRYSDTLKKRGKTILLSCHDPSIPLLLNSNVIVLESGKLKRQGAARSVLTLDTMKEIYGCELIDSSELPYRDVSLRSLES